MQAAGVEGEVGRSEEVAVGVGPGAEAVVVAEQHHVGHVELFEDVALQLKLAAHAEVRHVAAVDDEVHVAAPVDGAHAVVRFVIPPLRVAHHGEAHGVASGEVAFDAFDVAAVEVVRPAHAGVVGMVVDEVAGREQQPGGSGEEETWKVGHRRKLCLWLEFSFEMAKVSKSFGPRVFFLSAKMVWRGAGGISLILFESIVRYLKGFCFCIHLIVWEVTGSLCVQCFCS